MSGPCEQPFAHRQSITNDRQLSQAMADSALNTTTPLSSKGTLLGLLESAKFSDVAVIVGTGETKTFNLHRNIICVKSAFFETACKELFVEGINKTIPIPDIDIETFEVIATWLYDGGYNLPPNPKESCQLIFATYNAADYLQLPKLRYEIADKVRQAIIADKKSGPFRQILPDHHTFLRQLFMHAHMSDWDSIRMMLEELVFAKCPNEKGLRKCAAEMGSAYATVMIEVLQSALFAARCGTCAVEDLRNQPQLCSGCGMVLNYRRPFMPEVVEQGEGQKKD